MIPPIAGELLGAALLGASSRYGTGGTYGVSGVRQADASGGAPASTTAPSAGGTANASGGANGVTPAGAANGTNAASGATPANGANGDAAAQMQGAGRNEKGRFDRNECQTCKNRTYQDGSNDPGVSFKSPTKMAPEQAASAVMGHEMEHVNRNRAKAASEGREVISQSVTLHNAICSECGKSYVAGGVTRTVTANKRQNPYQAAQNQQADAGQKLNAVA